MNRRSLDLTFSFGGLIVAILLAAAGFTFKANADFAKDYVHDQLSAQKITFTPAANLADEEKKAACLVEYAGTPLDSGKKAECYANDYIALHVTNIGGGDTYATIGAKQRQAQADLQAAVDSKAANVPELQAALDKINSTRDTLFKGETLRGLLLTSYGFSIFGEKASLAAMLAFIGAVIVLIASLAGFAHAAGSKKE